MRIGELSKQTGVPVATIKYYLREGLLPRGVLTSPNQARYGEEHVRRVKMIRALGEIGGLPISQTKDVLAAIDRPEAVAADILGTMSAGLAVPAVCGPQEVRQAAHDRIAKLVRSLGWKANATTPAGHALVAAVAALYELGREDLVDILEPYAAVCAELARIDMSVVSHCDDNPRLMEDMVIGTVIGDVMLLAIRRLAHQDLATQLSGRPAPVT